MWIHLVMCTVYNMWNVFEWCFSLYHCSIPQYGVYKFPCWNTNIVDVASKSNTLKYEEKNLFNFKLFGFEIFWLWASLMKIIPNRLMWIHLVMCTVYNMWNVFEWCFSLYHCSVVVYENKDLVLSCFIHRMYKGQIIIILY
jgi:hypothetical protein